MSSHTADERSEEDVVEQRLIRRPSVWVAISEVNGCALLVEDEMPTDKAEWPGVQWIEFSPANVKADREP